MKLMYECENPKTRFTRKVFNGQVLDTVYEISRLFFCNVDMQQINISLICDKSVTTQNLVFLSYWCRNKRLKMHFLKGIVS
jgi:hypothetical protein